MNHTKLQINWFNTQHTYLEQLHCFKYTVFYFWRPKSLLIFTQLQFTQVYLKVHQCNYSLSIRQIATKTLRTYVWNWWQFYLSIWQKLFIYSLLYSNYTNNLCNQKIHTNVTLYLSNVVAKNFFCENLRNGNIRILCLKIATEWHAVNYDASIIL